MHVINDNILLYYIYNLYYSTFLMLTILVELEINKMQFKIRNKFCFTMYKLGKHYKYVMNNYFNSLYRNYLLIN